MSKINKLGQYKGVEVKVSKQVVTEEEIDNQIKALLAQKSTLEEKDGEVSNGDVTTIDFEGFKDGEAFQGGKGEDYPLVIGSGSFIPGFEEALIGMEVGEEKSIDLTFPETYHAEELKGQAVTFKVKIKELKSRVYPEYDKNFFEDLNMPQVDSLDKLKEEIKNHIKSHKEASAEDKYFEDCLTKVSENATISVPDTMINEEMDRIIEDFSSKLEMQGMNIEIGRAHV